MPESFYRQWIGVALEESAHYQMLESHLNAMGYGYGDFPAHDGLWEMAERTQDDVLARLALVPRTLEARGLDASPAVRHKLASGGDPKGAAIIDIICVMKSAMWQSVITGSAGCARSGGLSPFKRMLNLQSNTVRRHLKDLLMSRHG